MQLSFRKKSNPVSDVYNCDEILFLTNIKKVDFSSFCSVYRKNLEMEDKNSSVFVRLTNIAVSLVSDGLGQTIYETFKKNYSLNMQT